MVNRPEWEPPALDVDPQAGPSLVPEYPDPAVVAFGEAVPDLLLSMLERRYLADFQPSYWQLGVTPDDAARPLLREVRALGRPAAGGDRGWAMPYVLTAVHAVGQATVMAVYGDGRRHRIFLGGRRLANARGSTADFMEGQSSVLRAHVPGLLLGPVARLDAEELPELAGFLQAAPALAVVTGIPSARGGGVGAVPSAFQNIDRLIGAVGIHRYVLMVVAEPLEPSDLDRTLDRCRRLNSEVHVFVRRTVSTSAGESTSTSENTTRMDEKSTNPLPTYLYGLAAFCAVTGLIGPSAAFGGLAAPLLSSAGVVLSRDAQSASRSTTSSGRAETVTKSGTAELLDANAAACEALLGQHIARLTAARSSGWWRACVYVAAESDAALEAVTSALRGVCGGDATALDPLRVVRTAPWLVRSAATRGQMLSLRPAAGGSGHPLGPPYDALATCVGSDELAVLVNLPHRDVPGLPTREVGEFGLAAPEPADDAVHLGTLQDSLGRPLDPVTLTPQALNRHVFVTGMTGYGKTTMSKNLLLSAYEALGTPFLVIEPVKAEYRALADAGHLHGRLRVFTIGGERSAGSHRPAGASRILPLRLNPLAPVASAPLARHIDLLKAVFNASFPMFAGMSYMLEEAMLEVYRERGWNLRSSANDMLGPTPSADDLSALVPSIADLHDKIERILERKQYGREVHQNMGAALRSRLQSLMVGAKGMALNTRRSVPARELFTQPCVIELRNLGDDEEKSFVMALLLSMLYEFAEARHTDAHPGGAEQLRHLTLIEEAHRLLRAARAPGEPETPDAQSKAVTMFTDMLAEMRAYGEGFIVADQVPTKLAPETLKNSNVKILHRLVAPDDRAAVTGTVNLTDAQSRHLAALPPGVAVVHDDRIGSAVLVRMRPPEAVGGTTAGKILANADADPVANLPDLSYLFQNAGCRFCPAPCEFLDRTEQIGVSVDEADGDRDAALAPFFQCLLVGNVDGAWQSWSGWRTSWRQRCERSTADVEELNGLTYCAASQAGHRWLERTLVACRAASALPPVLDAAYRLHVDRSAQVVGRLCAAWCTATMLDGEARAQATAACATLGRLMGGQPPRELPGCAQCPQRCQMLPVIAPLLPRIAQSVVGRVTATTSVSARLRSLATITDPILAPLTEHESEKDRRSALLYCLVTTAAASTGADVTDILASIRAGSPAGTEGTGD